MINLFFYQLHSFYYNIKKRLYFWIFFFMIYILFVYINFQSSSDTDVLKFLLNGIPFNSISVPPIQIPVFWFFYLILPMLIISPSLTEIGIIKIEVLRGLRFSKFNFILIDYLIIIFFSISYVIVTFILFFLVSYFTNQNKLELHNFPIYIFLNIVIILGINSLLNLYSKVIGYLVPIFILIVTCYTIFIYNPLNWTMLSRISYLDNGFFILILENLILAILYYIKYKKREIY